jgi:hypothetical protein
LQGGEDGTIPPALATETGFKQDMQGRQGAVACQQGQKAADDEAYDAGQDGPQDQIFEVAFMKIHTLCPSIFLF